MSACRLYCERFNPTRYDLRFEGELEKVEKLVSMISKMSKKIRKGLSFDGVEEEGQGGPKESASEKTRLLEEQEEQASAKKQTEIDRLNEHFKTFIVNPITYNFNEDFEIWSKINYDESVMRQGLMGGVDLMDFRGMLEADGINFQAYGSMGKFDEATAKKVFEEMAKEDKNGLDFETMMETK